MFKPAQLVLLGALGAALAACGGGSSSGGPPAGGVPASPSAAASTKPAASAAAQPPAGGAAPGAAVVGAKAPGPYTARGSVTETGGQASIQTLDTLQWQPNTIVAKAGDKVTLQVQNSGNTVHNFISPGLGVPNGNDIPIQKTTAVSFTAPSAPGAYQFWCNIPGHAEAGMVGEVIVQ